MTYLGADPAKIVKRCEMLEKQFNLFLKAIDNYVSCYYEFQTTQVTCVGLRLSKTILTETAVFYFRDMDRYKREHGFTGDSLANSIKVGAFTTYWLSVKRPIYDTQDEEYASMVNDDFAIFTGLSMAEIDPHSARILSNGALYEQVKSLLSGHKASADALVPLYASMHNQAPSRYSKST
jgi:hypothetical protein